MKKAILFNEVTLESPCTLQLFLWPASFLLTHIHDYDVQISLWSVMDYPEVPEGIPGVEFYAYSCPIP